MKYHNRNKSFYKMSKPKLLSLIFIFLYPYIIGFTTDPDSTSTSETLVGVIFGLGSHNVVTRDCSRIIISSTGIPFKEAALAVEHREEWGRFYFKGGLTAMNEKTRELSVPKQNDTYGEWIYERFTTVYLNPSIGAEWKYFGIEAGVLFFTNSGIVSSSLDLNQTYPTDKLRIGNNRRAHFSFSFFNNVPLLSGGNIFDIGIGFGSEENRRLLLWLGLALSTGDDHFFPSLKTSIPFSEKLLLDLRANTGFNGKQFGLAAGVQMII
ncbi:MAG: hypothetical protein A2315_03110 [Ignavibacteria bacterium RIFOXYB2_FULL_35_12]|nr:MAG: hypothetical protein A2006_02350 [Ignavibacteria bacterium GWC2_35_8]OGU61699.1 MAG: hypothetical protein A2X60_03655 [Ignavibacteria bacterium GWF2_35_20]OGU78584.1 MAG: hypothetical protein A2254_07195 [Ignavibacteria bacterium RIFOXYA2_FULL_35_9]OGU85600.1 MAG: hypothetical protein A3K31_15290 [Ignavibacteria bacterium RIFOXYA12_FULL_35_25]OGU96303.1 MAG: hypothetical protein A2347_01980 [Ignavibacteria bacterium RIFOXYB12_FULL_35_14]OGU99551.1 MAG: hypothetical protein A2455_01130 